jgi:hypothetical protein
MQDPKYVINLVELQNINTSSTGESALQDIQNMVSYGTKTVSTDFLNSFSGGDIAVGSGLVLSGNITVGGTIITTSSEAGSSGLTVSGDEGLSAVYDTLYNPPVSVVGNLLAAAPYTGSGVVGTGFTVTRSGLFYVQLIVTVGVGAVLPAGGLIGGGIFANGAAVVSGSQQTVVAASLVAPASGTLSWTFGGVCELGTAATYTYQLSSSGSGWNLGTGGGVVATLYRLS